MEEQRFIALWQRLRGGPGTAAQVFSELSVRYAAPGRYYHSPRHITHCLKQLDAAREEISKPDQVELALWFHDAVYLPKAGDNEHRSAQLFLDMACDLPGCIRQSVSDLILATVHPNEPQHPDHQAVVDIDLSSFGQSWNEFLRDSRDVRAEFSHLSHDSFLSGQGAFLKCLLSRKRFFLTPYFYQRLESQARNNIRRYMSLMESTSTVH